MDSSALLFSIVFDEYTFILYDTYVCVFMSSSSTTEAQSLLIQVKPYSCSITPDMKQLGSGEGGETNLEKEKLVDKNAATWKQLYER